MAQKHKCALTSEPLPHGWQKALLHCFRWCSQPLSALPMQWSAAIVGIICPVPIITSLVSITNNSALMPMCKGRCGAGADCLVVTRLTGYDWMLSVYCLVQCMM